MSLLYRHLCAAFFENTTRKKGGQITGRMLIVPLLSYQWQFQGLVSSGGATVKSLPFWRHKVPSFVRREQPNPLHDAAGRRDYNDLSFFTGTLSQRPFLGHFYA